jgi:hypothetical protein
MAIRYITKNDARLTTPQYAIVITSPLGPVYGLSIKSGRMKKTPTQRAHILTKKNND